MAGGVRIVSAAWTEDAPRLSLRSRALLEASVAGDIALRTALASVLGGALARAAVCSTGRREGRMLAFYAELAETGDPGEIFATPPRRVKVQAAPGRELGLAGGRVEGLRFRTPYRAINKAARPEYDADGPNRIAVAEHWIHESGPRRTLAVIHGFGASPVWLNTAFFSLREFFSQGWDILLYTLPFHGSRAGSRLALNGIEMFSGGAARVHEAIIHAVFDFRILLDYLERRGTPRVGVTGLSLGGYISALLAVVEARLDFVIPNAPVTWIPSLLSSWTPLNVTVGLAQRALGISEEVLTRAFAVHSPLSYAAAVPKERLMIVCGLGDRLAPPEQGILLWEHWGRPSLHWFAGSHVLHFGRRAYLDEMRELMAASDPRRGRAPRRDVNGSAKGTGAAGSTAAGG